MTWQAGYGHLGPSGAVQTFMYSWMCMYLNT